MLEDKIQQCEADIAKLQESPEQLRQEKSRGKVYLGDVFRIHDDVRVVFVETDYEKGIGQLIYCGFNLCNGTRRSGTEVKIRDGDFVFRSDFPDGDLFNATYLGNIRDIFKD